MALLANLNRHVENVLIEQEIVDNWNRYMETIEIPLFERYMCSTMLIGYWKDGNTTDSCLPNPINLQIFRNVAKEDIRRHNRFVVAHFCGCGKRHQRICANPTCLAGYDGSNLEHSLMCNGCKNVYYCSLKCQKKHWKSAHKKDCDRIRQMRERVLSCPKQWRCDKPFLW